MPDDRSNLNQYNRNGSKYDPKGGNGPTGSGNNNSGGRNRYGDRNPYGNGSGGRP